ncbi:MAG TPA: cysteine desulfurase-like protein [Pedococcus sp.]|jgi:cysteine desulfurase family protein (TIGR01976 family)|uniref:cysteine desulfurase-like protein n=1 Tax=Pedococcus sp. TaxID=2860345 RepID=UPI002F930CA9
MSLDVDALRAHFPALKEGAAHFDGPGGSQVPDVVGAAVAETLTSAIANRGTTTRAERRAEQVVLDARGAMADLLGADPRGVVFGRSMTALTYDMARTLAATWSPGDEVVVTRLDHDANIRPWVQAAERAGARVRWAEFDTRTGELPAHAVGDLLTERTRLVAVTAASNLIGTRPDLPAIADLVHGTGALLYVDGVHYTAHVGVDLRELGADLFACSPYKFMGPHCGVLAASPELLETLHPDKLLPSTNEVPERFELGTLPYELLAGTTAAVDFIAALSPLAEAGSRRTRLLSAMQVVEEHEDRLRRRIEEGLAELPAAVVHSRAARRTPTLLVRFEGHDSQAVRNGLAERNINAPAGSFYAIEASRALGLGDGGAVRIGLAPYTSDDDVDRLLGALGDIVGG